VKSPDIARQKRQSIEYQNTLQFVDGNSLGAIFKRWALGLATSEISVKLVAWRHHFPDVESCRSADGTY
jgi:hypothetical protein